MSWKNTIVCKRYLDTIAFNTIENINLPPNKKSYNLFFVKRFREKHFSFRYLFNL